MRENEQFDDDYIGTPLSAYSKLLLNFNVGDIVSARVVKVEKDVIVAEVGDRNIGDIPIDEFKDNEIPKVGDEFFVFVTDIEEKEGKLLLSKKKADFELSWQKIEDIFQRQEKIKCKVLRSVKSGVMVEVLNFTGFVPASRIDIKRVDDLSIFEGKEYEFKIIEINKQEQKIILSRRKVLEEEIEEKKRNLFQTIKEGDIVEGYVEKIMPQSVIVRFDGISGIVHISEIAYRRITSPHEMLKEGEIVKCKIISKNVDEEKVELSIKQAQPNPWETIDNKFWVGKIVEGKVMRIFDFGAFVKVDEQIEGLIPTSEISYEKINKASDVISVGDTLRLKIIDLKKNEQRMILSLRAAKQEEEKKEKDDFLLTQQKKTITIGDVIGDILKDKLKE